MFYNEYLLKRMMMNKLTKRLEQKRKLQNKPITIKNLVVFPEDSESYGESKAYFAPSSNLNMVYRLIDHVKSLSQIANLHHQQAYCELAEDGQYRLKKEHHNTITRLSLSEFSLYGKKPLTMDEFNLVLTSIRVHAEKVHDNVHLLLSSFSVINDDKKILNISLYIQGGKEPKIDVITKAIASKIDVQYPDSIRFSQQVIGKITPEVSPFIAGNNNTISSNSILEITTKGDGKFLQTIDVCFDHVNQHSKKLLKNQIDALDLNNLNTHDFLPEQLDQIVTSNSLDLEDNAKLGYSVLHIDPRPERCFDKENKNRPLDTSSTLSEADINSVRKYPKTKIVSEPGKLTVTQPPFGPDYHIKVYQERQVGCFSSGTQDTIRIINDHIIKQQVKHRVISSENLKDMKGIEHTNRNAYILAHRLIIQLEEQCKPTWFERLFRTTNYPLKLNAKAIITESMRNLKEFQRIDRQCMFLAHASPWSRNMKFEWNNLTRFPNDFLKKLDDTVNIFQKKVETERPADIHTYS